MQRTPARQPSVDEMQPQKSLALTTHSPIGMEASPVATHSQVVAPQSKVEASLPPQVIVEEAREYDGLSGSGSQALKPSFMRKFKRIGMRTVKHPRTCKSPFFA